MIVLGCALMLGCTRAKPTPPALSKQALDRALAPHLPHAHDTVGLIALPSGRLVYSYHREALVGRRVLSGSVMKVFSAHALLRENKAGGHYRCKGAHRDALGIDRPCWYRPGHGEMSLHSAIAGSCNAFFYERTFGMKDRVLLDTFSEFGFGRPWLSDLSGVLRDIVPARIDRRDLPDVAVGDHLSMAVSPLSLLRATTVIATRGQRISPWVTQPGPRESTELDPRFLNRIAHSMEATPEIGTLKDVLPPGCACAKTGTAKKREARGTRGLVVGYAPPRAPRYAFVVVKSAGTGAAGAGPAAAALLSSLEQQGAIRCLKAAR